jgi:heme-degrading monooxygenase HmoA
MRWVQEHDMIARIWRGEAEAADADAYHRHVTTTVFPSLGGLEGHRGAYLLRRAAGGRVEFLAVTLWDSLDAVKGFAGADPDIAVVEPEARAVLAAFDDFARHYEVAHGAACGTSDR